MYCTQADLEQRLDPQALRALADDDQDGLADTAVVEAAIADACALIDARLRARYSVPFDSAPEVIRAAAAAIAIYLLLTRRRDSAPGEHRRRYEAALALLEQLALGRIALDAPQNDASTHLPRSSREDDERRFPEDLLENF